MKVAFVFPGQGSQAVGMFDAWQDHAVAREVVQQASGALGQDLLSLMHRGPASDLNLTINTQPVMLAASLAMYQAWLAEGGRVPAVMAGHSLGEYTALTAAGALAADDALRLVRVRASTMQNTVPVGEGGMAAILGLDDATVEAVCRQAAGDEVVEAVNFNAPAQVVIAGHVAAVDRACELAREQGARRAMKLSVSAPFHSSLLRSAATVLAQALDGIQVQTPAVPVINNVDVASPSEPAAIRHALTRQAWHPVRWVETIQAMQAQGVTHIVECGPGKVLAGLTRRIDKSLVALSVYDPETMRQTLETLQG